VRQYVRELRERHPEVFLPLDHEPGEAMQFDWGDMSAVIADAKITVSVFCAVLPHSGALCAFVYPDKSTRSFLHGHIQAFEFIGGVARRCVYDNLKTAVKKGSGKNAVKQVSFIRLEAHYGFEAVFCNVASGWEKANVENAVAIVRRIAFTPMPRVDSYEALQTHVTNRCLHYAQTHTIRGHEHSIRDSLEQERKMLLPLPDVRLDTGFTFTALVHPDLTVHHESTRYSVPGHLVGKEQNPCESEITRLAHKMKWPVLENYKKHVKTESSFEENLLALLQLEEEQRNKALARRRIKQAGFPITKTLDTFEFNQTMLPHLKQAGYLLWCVMLTLSKTDCKSFLRLYQNCQLQKRKSEGTGISFTPLYPPLAQILPQNRFPVNPWFTMNHGVQADLYVRYRQFTEAVRFIYDLVIRHTNV